MNDFRRLMLFFAVVVGISLWFRPWKPRETTVGELPVVTQTNTVAEVVTNDESTDAVVEKLVAAATNNEPAEISFSVRLRLADGKTNKTE